MTRAAREEAIIGGLLVMLARVSAVAVVAGGLWYFS
jgi:hypothetical protein